MDNEEILEHNVHNILNEMIYLITDPSGVVLDSNPLDSDPLDSDPLDTDPLDSDPLDLNYDGDDSDDSSWPDETAPLLA